MLRYIRVNGRLINVAQSPARKSTSPSGGTSVPSALRVVQDAAGQFRRPELDIVKQQRFADFRDLLRALEHQADVLCSTLSPQHIDELKRRLELIEARNDWPSVAHRESYLPRALYLIRRAGV